MRSLLDDVQSCLERITDLFSGKLVLSELRAAAASQLTSQPSSDTGAAVSGEAELKCNVFRDIEVEFVGDQLAADWLVSNQLLMVKVLKLSLKECLVMMCKIAMICDLFAHRKSNLTRQERHEVSPCHAGNDRQNINSCVCRVLHTSLDHEVHEVASAGCN